MWWTFTISHVAVYKVITIRSDSLHCSICHDQQNCQKDSRIRSIVISAWFSYVMCTRYVMGRLDFIHCTLIGALISWDGQYRMSKRMSCRALHLFRDNTGMLRWFFTFRVRETNPSPNLSAEWRIGAAMIVPLPVHYLMWSLACRRGCMCRFPATHVTSPVYLMHHWHIVCR
jgi:hypothetical protein